MGLNTTSPEKTQGLVITGVEEGVTVGVAVGVGEIDDMLALIDLPPQGGVTEGVGVIVGVVVLVGVILGVGWIKQSKIASKSKLAQGFVVVVVVTQIPIYITVSSKSGVDEVLPYVPNSTQGSPKLPAKHHLFSGIE